MTSALKKISARIESSKQINMTTYRSLPHPRYPTGVFWVPNQGVESHNLLSSATTVPSDRYNSSWWHKPGGSLRYK